MGVFIRGWPARHTVPHTTSVRVTPTATIVASSVANPTVITTLTPHYLVSGDTADMAGHTGSTPTLDGSHVVTAIGALSFSVPVSVSVGGTGGTVTRTVAAEPVTLADVRSYLQLPDDLTDQDDNIETWITEGRQLVEQVTERALLSQVWDVILDWFPSGREIRLPRSPVLSVVSVTSYTDAGIAAVLSPSNYYGVVGETGRVVLLDSGAWPTDVRRVEGGAIRYVAGYGTTAASVPEPLRGMIKTLVKRRYDGLDMDPVRWDDIAAYLPVVVA